MELGRDHLVHVLQYVPLEHRFFACAMVCRLWRAATVEGTTCVQGRFCSKQCQSLQQWLMERGSNIEVLHLEGITKPQSQPPPETLVEGGEGALLGIRTFISIDGIKCPDNLPLLQLPFHQLQKLEQMSLQALKVEAKSPGVSGPALSSVGTELSTTSSWSHLSALTSLKLQKVQFCSAGFISEMSGLARLKTLQMGNIIVEAQGQQHVAHQFKSAAKLHQGLRDVLGSLTRLTHLSLTSGQVNDQDLSTLSGLSKLQQLRLACAHVSAEGLANLPTSLTDVELWGFRPQARLTENTGGVGQHVRTMTMTTDSTPVILRLTKLQRLVIGHPRDPWFEVILDPIVLSNLVDLQHLELAKCLVGSAELLGVLPWLANLRHLSVRYTMHNLPPESELQHYSALAINSQLTHLELTHCNLPDNLFKHMLERQQPGCLSDLHSLCITLQNGRETVLGGPGELDLLAKCCPNLQHLELCGDPQQAELISTEQLPVLSHFTGLTRLKLRGAAVPDAIAPAVLVQLTGLASLEIIEAERFTAVGMQHLTALTQLTELKLDMWDPHNGYFTAVNKASKGYPSDVPQQLQEMLRQRAMSQHEIHGDHHDS